MKTVFLLLQFLFFSIISNAQTNEEVLNDTLSGAINFFGEDTPLSFTLKSDFKKFRKEKYKGKYQNAQLVYQINDSTKINKQVRIKARGEFRRKHCNFPPIRLNWRKTKIVKNEFSRYYKLKMVAHCNGVKYYKNYVLKEYLCYKLYNILTDMSFRVRLVDVKYIDTGHRKQKEYKTSAFFIEDLEMLADRSNALVLENEKLSQHHVEEKNILQVAFFMFMIGNADWSVPRQHNIKLLKSKNYNVKKAWAIPYDFDYTGMVNAGYAIPDEERLGVEKITERVYLGLCKPENEFKPIIELFKNHKDEFYDVITNFEYLEPQYKKEMTNYLDEFYHIIESANFYKNYLKKHCKKLN